MKLSICILQIHNYYLNKRLLNYSQNKLDSDHMQNICQLMYLNNHNNSKNYGSYSDKIGYWIPKSGFSSHIIEIIRTDI